MATNPGSLISGALTATAITIADGETDASPAYRGLSLSTNATVSIKLEDAAGFVDIFLNGGVIHPIRFINIQATGTTAGITAFGYK